MGLNANGVFRGDKHTIYEGGVRVPLIVRWDGKVAEGIVSDRMINITDIYSTLVEVVSGEKPTGEEAPDSVSFAPTMLGESQEARAAMITSNVAGLHAIREGDWKYIDGRYPKGTPQNFMKSTKKQSVKALYNLKVDPSETKNVVDDYPELVGRMQQMLDDLRANTTRK
jgi:arylsulfatase A-like enzyme